MWREGGRGYGGREAEGGEGGRQRGCREGGRQRQAQEGRFRAASLKGCTESDVLGKPADMDTLSHFLLFLSLEKL